ncbi:MAG TPA: amino acid ABC transporter substrate-binding protein [Anaerolineae bacterium]|nr:amino acid ABC transporter substrate-binding protein [Anaerolineae bacterium]
MKWSVFFILLVVLALLAAQCGAAPTQAPAAPAQEEAAANEPAAPASGEKTVIIGFTSSKTGSQEVPSTGQTRGLELWLEQVNKTGVKLGDGTIIKFEPKTYDDESNKDRVQQLYTTLINEDKADFLISPYSSGSTDAAAVIAEQGGKVMITAGAASDSTHAKGFQLIFQMYTPASRYLTGAIDLLASMDAQAKKLAIVHENDKFSTDVATAAEAYAKEKGYEVVLFEGYDSATTDFGPFINKISAAAPDAIMGGGHFPDGSTFAKQLYEKGVKVKMVTLLVAPPELKFAEIGEAAKGIVGPSQWEPQASYTSDVAKTMNVEWYGPTVEEFTKAYQAKYGEEPAYHAAGGYAAGLVLQKAIETAGSVETQKVAEVLNKLDLMTFYGHVKFDTTPENHGLQIGHDMVYIQWQVDTSGKLVKQVVWPPDFKSAEVASLEQ